METFTRVVYGVFGVGAVAAGLAAVFVPGLVLPPDYVTPMARHLIREEGALMVFVGLMSLWCLRHYDDRRPVHAALLVTALIFAGIHWVSFFNGGLPVRVVVVNSVPPLLLLLTFPRTRT
jgi:uncharacterized protein DUF4345